MATSLDDLLQKVFKKLLASTRTVAPTRGKNLEVAGILLKLKNPRARLSRTEAKGTIFSCLGELLWYLAGSNKLDFVQYYLPRYDESAEADGTIWGAYGPRLQNMRGVNQLDNVIERLRRKPDTRRAVIQLFNAEDILQDYADAPCTCTLQFMIREGKLELFTSMRSNDAFIGLPHDIFAFTMLQELVARILGVDIGVYSHAVGSLHLYDRNIESAKSYIEEGWQRDMSMPPMPSGDPEQHLIKLLEAETRLRHGSKVDVGALSLPEYWADLARLLQIFSLSKIQDSTTGTLREIIKIKNEMSSPIYNQYIRKREKVVGDRIPLGELQLSPPETPVRN